jgi:hypothetical protein
MENLYIAIPSRNYFKSFSLSLLIVIGFLFAGNASAQITYQAEGDIKVSGGNKYSTTLAASKLTAEGDFILSNGVLDEISTLKFFAQASNSISLNDNVDHINFKITNTMVLPIMRKVFICAILNNGTDSYRVDMDFDMTMNQDQSISFNGTKTIKSKSFYNFYQKPVFDLASTTNTDEVQLNINLVFRQVVKPVVIEEIAVIKPIERINTPLSAR